MIIITAMTAVIKKLFAGAILSVGLLISGAGVASAAGIPDATATGAVSIAASSAALNASIEPNGAQTEYWMEFGTSSNFERATNRYPVSRTTGSVSVSQTVTNCRLPPLLLQGEGAKFARHGDEQR
jgi:hypothetical protein